MEAKTPTWEYEVCALKGKLHFSSRGGKKIFHLGCGIAPGRGTQDWREDSFFRNINTPPCAALPPCPAPLFLFLFRDGGGGDGRAPRGKDDALWCSTPPSST